jgi:hypothetical protein
VANTKETLLDSLVTMLGGITSVTCTRRLKTPQGARDAAPYIGLLASTEEVLVRDATHTRWGLTVDLILMVQGEAIEDLIVDVKDIIEGDTLPTGALQMRLVGQEPVNLITDDAYSSSRIVVDILYVSAKGAN